MAISQIACLLCNSPLSKGQLYGHISQHFDFHRYRCVTCNFSASFSDDVANHAMEEDHNLKPEDNSLAHPYVHQLVNLVASQSRASAGNFGATAKILLDLDACILSYEKQRLLSPADTQIPCLICGSAVANSEYHVGLKHFNGFVRFRCSNCPFKAPFSDIVVNHALERDHDPKPIDGSIQFPYAYRLIYLIVWQSRAAFSDQSLVRVYADLDNLTSSADAVALGQDALCLPARRADLNLAIAHSQSPVLSAAAVVQESGTSTDSGVISPEHCAASTPSSIDHSASSNNPPQLILANLSLPNRVSIAAIKQELSEEINNAIPPEPKLSVRCALCPAGTNGLLASDKEAHVFRHVEVSGVAMGSNDAAFFDEVSRVWLLCFPEDAPAEANDGQSHESTNPDVEANVEINEGISDDTSTQDALSEQSRDQLLPFDESDDDSSHVSAVKGCEQNSAISDRRLSRRIQRQAKQESRTVSVDETSRSMATDERRVTTSSPIGVASYDSPKKVGGRQESAVARPPQQNRRIDTCAKCKVVIDVPFCRPPVLFRQRRLAALRRHVWRVHAPRLPYGCLHCEYRSYDVSNMQRHRKKWHAGERRMQARPYAERSEAERMQDLALFTECFPMLMTEERSKPGRPRKLARLNSVTSTSVADAKMQVSRTRLFAGSKQHSGFCVGSARNHRNLADDSKPQSSLLLTARCKVKKAFSSSVKSSGPVKGKIRYVCRVCNTQVIWRPLHVWDRHMEGLKRWTCSVCKASNNDLKQLKAKCAANHPRVESLTEASSDSVQRKFELAFEQCFADQPDALYWQPAKINVEGGDGSAKTASTSVRISTKRPHMKRRRTLPPASRGFFDCKLCSALVRCDGKLSRFQRHVSACALGKNNTRFKCSVCDFTGSHRGNVNKHIATHNKSDKIVYLIDCGSESFADKRSCFAACFPNFLHLFDTVHPSASAPRLMPKLTLNSRAQGSINPTSSGIDLSTASGVSKFHIDNDDGSAHAEAEGESDSPFEGFHLSDLEPDNDDTETPSESDSETVTPRKSSLVECKPIMM